MHRRPPRRLPSFDYRGNYRYSLRFCTEQRAAVFVSDEPVELVLSQIMRAAVQTDMAVIAYCFMPDHVHLLVEGTSQESDCRRFIVSAKQYSGYCYARKHHRRLWQQYAYERVLRDEESTLEVARYILANPIRTGLAATAEEYPYGGSLVYALEELMEAVQDMQTASS